MPRPSEAATPPPSNAEIVAAIDELRLLTGLNDGDPRSFRARAYANAVQVLGEAKQELSELSQAELMKLPGVGKATAAKVRELVDTGAISKLSKLRAAFPAQLQRLARVPGLSAKTLVKLRDQLGVASLADLQRALEKGAVASVSGVSRAVVASLHSGVRFMRETHADRLWPAALAMPVAQRVRDRLLRSPGVARAEVSGELRRLLPLVERAVVVAAAQDPVVAAGALAALPDLKAVSQADHGPVLETHRGLPVEVVLVPPEAFGVALAMTTGPEAHVQQLTTAAGGEQVQLAVTGLRTGSGELLPCQEEADIYHALKLQFLPAPMRGTVAAVGDPQTWVELAGVRGDLHTHTDLSGDGRSPLKAMAAAASERGYTYYAVTDHAEGSVGGASAPAMIEQRAAIRRVGEEIPALRLLHGVELNIGADGELDYDLEFRRSFDWCVASVHSHFGLERAAQTRRIVRAMQDESVRVIGHLTGRMIGRRPGIDLDLEVVWRTAAETGTAIELNAALPRMDPDVTLLEEAAGFGVLLVVNSDAHHVSELDRMQWGAGLLQRARIDPERVINTWESERFMAWLDAG